MVTKVHQQTRVQPGLNSIKINNNFPRKRVSIKNLPRGAKIHVVDSSFVKPENLKGRMSKIKASAQFKRGEAKVRTKLQSMKIKQGDRVKINIS